MTTEELMTLKVGDRVEVLESWARWDGYRGMATILDIYGGEALVQIDRIPGCGVWFLPARLALAAERAGRGEG